jgi:hypothetical protein
MNGLRYMRWSRLRATAYFVKGAANKLRIAPTFFCKLHNELTFRDFKKRWLRQGSGVPYFDICGAKLPDVSSNQDIKYSLASSIFDDTFLIPAYYGNSYHKALVNTLDKVMGEGPYGYTDGTFDVTVKKGDVVIDAGAWIGDFSAYAASQGATAYAFEPVSKIFQWLHKTQLLNNAKSWGGVK